ncbi:von Willebrand factor C domain-containing protein 2-like [Haliotis rubra]|uniref:von Willebrand factor C domain-containing protein 2-like n=1 Tax=Haliotis rubra TaxID=36100 RepID=UPI001EE5A822|nr:von Willebrand factor C domain-containing protein 2-like [Haliotis rubra]
MFSYQHYVTPLVLISTASLLICTEGSTETVKATTCQYRNVTYAARQTFKPDPCTFCKCPRGGGEARCAIMDCKWEPHCLKFATDHDVCCPTCLHYGCLHSDGKVYEVGSVVSRGNCSTCYCPESGGRTVCEVTQCPRPRCVDHVVREGTCCPSCPNGHNCQYKGHIIPANKILDIDHRRCRCKRLKLARGTSFFASCRKKHYWRAKH